uniref:Gamma-tubulin complex component n=1 Tax=Oryza glumipatula TaxID=40148 RepID=A0A0D9ZUE6_9ORYZ
MLHELLLALLSFTGDFVLDAASSPSATRRRRPVPPEAAGGGDVGPASFRLAPDLTFLQPSERSAIERLISLGFYYRELNRFATESRDLSWINSPIDVSPTHGEKTVKAKVRKGSAYRRAIANGIAEILSVYRSAVLQVEQNLLSDPLPILATVTHGLNKFEVLLPPLHELVMEIEQKDIKGGQLLNLLHKRCHCGVPELQSCIQRLLWHGHQVMFNQLTSWMVYGILQDQYNEFFIRRQEDRDEENDSSQVDVADKFTQKSAKETSLTSWHTGFHVSLDMLPEYIHMRVAESILFAGKAIRVLRNPSPGATLQESMNQSQNVKGSYRMQSLIGGSGALKELPNFPNISAEELLPQAEADKIDAMLKELKCFLEESRQLMRLPPRQSTAEADLMVPFQLAALKTIGDEDKYFARVSLRMSSFGIKASTSQKDLQKSSTPEISSQGKATSELALDGWDSIALEYSVDWPLQLFFTPDVVSKYRKVFQYLIRLKRTQMELEKSWAAVMHQDHADFSDYCKDRKNGDATQLRRQRSKPFWRVREHMAFLIRNLQFYIQVDVIESQWNVLQAHVQDSHDFTELVTFHQEYLSALISQSFLDIGSVSRILDSIMKLCLQFCWSIEQYENRRNMLEIDHITEEFNKKSNSLYTILRSSRLAGSQRAPFLRQFLMRLNYNSFFETTARGVMNSAGGRLRPSTAGTQL